MNTQITALPPANCRSGSSVGTVYQPLPIPPMSLRSQIIHPEKVGQTAQTVGKMAVKPHLM